jgi:CRISPR-associated endonuclease Csn1
MSANGVIDYVLGIDLGTNSLGWAMVKLVDDNPAGLLRAGSRVFEAGMEGDLESGQEESRNKARRDVRLHRRQLWRRARRLKKIFKLLQAYGLLPARNLKTPDERQDLLNEIDQHILGSKWFAAQRASGKFPEPGQTLPYILRAAALDQPLEPHFLGRALYHLAQRRGFLSNRKQAAKEGEDEGAVKSGIKQLRRQMGGLTLGQYLATLSPSERRIRGPERWTHRDMFKQEFEKIWDAQKAHHPDVLTEQRRKELRKTLFFQRPLWFDPNTIGRCELEPGSQRAPMYTILAQRFRLLQKVNDLQIEPPAEAPRYLTPEERVKLSGALELLGDLNFQKARKVDGLELPSVRDLLDLPKKTTFNLERGGEKKIPGNRTTSQFYAVFGKRWLEEMSADEHEKAIHDVLSIQNQAALKRRGVNHWMLDEKAAEAFCEISLEPEYMNLSRAAMQKLLPLLEQGLSYASARRQVYPESFQSTAALPSLPALQSPEAKQFVGEIRNPAVMRSLTELRKVVNALIRENGKPTYIHVELARELKKPKKARVAASKKNRENQASRQKAADRVRQLTGDSYPSRDDIRRVQLFDDGHGQCVYCGENIAGNNFLGKESQVDIDHIIPFSRSLDDSYVNLVVCHSACNRAKGNRTPFEAFSGERYDQIIDRVKKFAGDKTTTQAKLRRFLMDDEKLKEFLDDFRTRQLNDTAYSSKLAKKYLGLLYGGGSDAEGDKRVFPTAGRTTAYFRGLWKLNRILNDGPTTGGGRVAKSRDDHRHHAIDATVIALTNDSMIKRLADAAARGQELGKRFGPLEGPWPNFVDSVRAQIDKIVVSHRVSKKISGALHKETIYSPKVDEKGRRHHRVALTELSQKDLTSDNVIIDAGVRKRVQERLFALGAVDPMKAFAAPENLPFFETADGRKIQIKKVRIGEVVKTRKVGDGFRERFVKPGGNHHLEIFGQPGSDGRDKKWDTPGVVTMLEAFQRLRNRPQQPVVRKQAEPGWEFRFSLAPGEVLECDNVPQGRRLLVVRTISEEEKTGSVKIEMIAVNDARKKDQIKKSKQWITRSPNELRKMNARKVIINPLGEVSEAQD